MGTVAARLRTLLRSNIVRLLALALLVGLIAVRVTDPVFVSNIRNQSFDLYQRLNTRQYAPMPVAIVDIDEASLAKYGQWPWPRTRLAELVQKLTAAGAAAIGFDIVFAEPDRLSPANIAADNPGLPEQVRAGLATLPDNETAFAQAIAASRVVVGETGARTPSEATARPIPKMPSAVSGPDPSTWLVRFPDLVQNMPAISDAAAGHGVFSIDPDPDGVFRRLPLVMMARDELRLALSTELLRIATGGNAFVVKTDGAGVRELVVGRVAIATDPQGKVWPWFSKSDPRRYVAAGDILAGTAPPNAVAGKLVLVGTSAVGLEDYRPTPVEAAMPGVEVHAQLIENMMAGQLLKRPNYALGMELSFIALAGLAIIVLVPLLGAVWSALAALVFMGAFAGGSWWAFSQQHMLIDATWPLAATFAMFVTMATGNYMREEAQRAQIRSAFGQYLSPALVEQLSADPSRLKLGGETRELSVLFTDVRGFTTISESFKANPQGLTRLMNRFLTVMSNAILDREGTLDKYMGDAIMAFWNAPVPCHDHAVRSCRAALLMLERVAALNASAREEVNRTGGQFHQINIGVGINSGFCVVGNMGSEMRFDYTALGDTVNLASRLEGQSKPFGLSVILGSATAQAVLDRMAVLEIDMVRVKGKKEPERIFTLIGGEAVHASEAFVAVRAMNAAMLAAYRSQNWDAALDALGQLAKLSDSLGLKLDEYLFVYETRITEYRDNPPGPNWDAVYQATEK